MKRGKVNPLEVFGVRRVNFCPSYFEDVTINTRYNLSDAMVSWIDENLSGRYYIGKAVNLDEQNKISQVTRIGFEKESELSYFMLACPHLKYH